ncbi:acetyl-CoA C-acyltransferase [Crenobacter luteus]|uniref:Acetyl-CoA acetyltransferase n=1 Tax=Crenobacter luteus TaxID=1452487 RepID=A0A165EP74_9NEIS|nr:acetyl-CoA C-acyltransferase [Crenobacter luteus]KZE27361.1 acetyl-CoA acetyltransferase [Crenobacter luteus]
MHNESVMILSARRTPIGAFCGVLSGLSACELGAAALRDAAARARFEADAVDEVLMGCVLPAGLGQAPARQAARGAGLADAVGATTVNKVCGSGLKAVMLGYDMIRAGSARRILAGGMESMSNAPHLLPRSRRGWRMGSANVEDHMMLDGLEDADESEPMGVYAERCAHHYGFTRGEQDAFALASLERALAARGAGEIVPLTVATRVEDIVVDADEPPARARPDKVATLAPAFVAGGTVTAANSSSLADGAAALALAPLSEAERLGATPLARIVGHAAWAQEPAWFTTAPVGAIDRLLTRLGWTVDDVDLFEINEAFAVVVLAAMRELKLPHEKVNVRGGSCALGHPIGASGARIVVTLLAALEERGLRRGVAALCIGGGEAVALAVERVV